MKADIPEPIILTGVRNLDEVIHGGIPSGEQIVFAVTQGSGNTILAHKIIKQNATPEALALSRFGVEEAVRDGIILLTASNNPKTLMRKRFLEIYKLRNTAHVNGRHMMDIGITGIMFKPKGLINIAFKKTTKKKV